MICIQRNLNFIFSELIFHFIILICLKVGIGAKAEDMAEEVRKMLGGDGAHVTIECSGVEASIR